LIRKDESRLEWQSKAVLLIVAPWTAVSVLLQGNWWFTQVPVVAWTALGISGVFGLVVWRLRAGTAGAAATGAVISASLMLATVRYPYESSWLHGGLLPLLTVFLLAFAATKIGATKKEQIGTAESKRGRNAAQVAANLGVAALAGSSALVLGWMGIEISPMIVALAVITALAEAAADTVSSEIGQVFGGQPRMLTTLRRVDPGTDGAVTLAGTAAGVVAASIVSAIGGWALGVGWSVCVLCIAGAVLGLFFDSLLGATLERKGWLNNDAVNFLSTLSAPVFALLVLLAYSYAHSRHASGPVGVWLYSLSW